MPQLLACKQCGAPLTQAAVRAALTACAHCGAAHAMSRPPLRLDPNAPAAGSQRDDASRRAWEGARAGGADAIDAVRAAVPPMSAALTDDRDVERAARLAVALLEAFDAEHATSALTDWPVIGRVVNAAVMAVVELRSSASTDVNLPFLTATSAGPLHLRKRLTPQDLADLDLPGLGPAGLAADAPDAPAAPDPPDAPAAAAATPSAGAPAPRRRWWWPFG